MPHTRFYNLSAEKQQEYYNIALKEFSSKGFRKTSLNQIIKKLGISKGTMYYYFEGKKDLYFYVIKSIIKDMNNIFENNFYPKNASEYWEYTSDIAKKKIRLLMKKPAYLNISRDFIKNSETFVNSREMVEIMEFMNSILHQFLKKGRELGAVRKSIPEDLLINILFSCGLAMDKWIFQQVNNLEELFKTNPEIIDTLTTAYVEIWRGISESGYLMDDKMLEPISEIVILSKKLKNN
ncbi:MAG: TetR/AcrR family transcriptional regulator [Myxococcota bacterium]